MKIAIVHDELLRRGGAEKVFLSFHYAFPEADIFVAAFNANNTYSEFGELNVHTSLFNFIARDEDQYKKFFYPLGIWAMELMDLSDYDLILQSNSHCSKYIKVSKSAIVITYCHNPFRLAWNPESYSEYLNATGIKKTILNFIIHRLKKIDFKYAQRTNYFLTNALEPKERILKYYNPGIEPIIINPPVTISNFYVSNKKKEYYLLISRLEFYKKIDLVINVFNQLEEKLIIVGKGSKELELKKMANSNIEFRKSLSTSELAELYANCKGFLMPQHEDYGITPLEANASGRPVIAYAKGGVLETMIPYQKEASKCTALFFDEQSEECLFKAIQEFEKIEFDSEFIRNHALKFDESNFIQKIKEFVLEKAKL
jgi:glycosyltransferase involved in cell wall biosynthesis